MFSHSEGKKKVYKGKIKAFQGSLHDWFGNETVE